MATRGDEEGDCPTDSSPYTGLRSYGSYLSPSGEDAEVVHLYECGECEIASPYVRTYSLPTVILLPFVVVWRVDEVMKCPRCMRNHIMVRLPLTILLSNLISPMIVLWWLIIFVRTFFSRPF